MEKWIEKRGPRVKPRKGETAMRGDCLTMTIGEFARAVGCSRNLAYALARQDKLPVPVIRLGNRRMVVSRRAVERLLAAETNDRGNGDEEGLCLSKCSSRGPP